MKLKPATAKGTYMRSITISTTHGPGVKVDPTPVHRTSRRPEPAAPISIPTPRRRSRRLRQSKSPAETSGSIAARTADARPLVSTNEGFRCFRRRPTWTEHKKSKSSARSRRRSQNVASIVIADYRGITVPVVTTMRDDFRKAGCHYRVLKNSLVKIAVKGSKMEPMTALMIGTTAVIWTTESPAAAGARSR